MDNIQVDESPNTKINKKKKSKLSTDMTDAGPSENSIEHSDANIIKPKKSFWKSIFRFKSRKQEMPESVVADMRRNAMKAPNLDTIFEEQEDSDISDSDSKVTDKTNASWIPLKDPDQASSKFESTTDEFLVDDSLSSEEEIPKEKIMLPEGNADKILKEIQAQLKKGKAKKLKDEQKSDSDHASTITKEDYSFEYSGSSGQSLDEEDKANKVFDQNKELVESLVNQLDANSSKPASIQLSQHPSKEVVAKLSEKKVTFVPAPFEDLPDIVADVTLDSEQMLSEDIIPSPSGSLGAEDKLDAKTTPDEPVATVGAVLQQVEPSTAVTSEPELHPSNLDPSAPSEDLSSLHSNKEKQVAQSSSQQQQFLATDMTRTAPPTNLNNNNYNNYNNNNTTHAISISTSTSNDDDDDDDVDVEQDWQHLFEDVEEHQMHQRLVRIKDVASSESINEIEVWCQNLNEMAPKQFETTARITAPQSIPTHPEECQKTLLPLQEYGTLLSSDEASDKTYGIMTEQTTIFSKAFMYNFHAETNFQTQSALDFSFPLKDGSEELRISTRTMEEKGDIRLDKFFKMIYDHASQNYIVVYDPIPTELPSSVLVPRGKERCKVTRKRKIMSLLHDKRVYDEYLKEFEAIEPINVDSTDRESKINLLLLEGSGTQVSSFGRSFGNSSTSDLRLRRRNDFNSGSDEAGPSKGFRSTKSLDDLCKNSKSYFVPSNTPIGLALKTSGASNEATTSALCTTMSIEEPGIAVVLEHTRKKLMHFISNHSERSSTEQLNSLYPNNYQDIYNISAGIHLDEDDQIDQISLDSIMSGFDHYDQVDQLTSVTSLEAYHTEKIETFETVEQDVRTLINELLVQVDELKEDCINAGVDRSSDGSLFGDITAKLSGAVAQNVMDEIIERTFQASKVQNANDAAGCNLSGDRLKAGDSKSQVLDNRDVKTSIMENQNVMDELVQANALTDECKFVPSAEPHLESISNNFSHLKDHPTTITIETNSEKQVFLKNHCSLKEGLQKTAGFLTSIYSELCEYNPVSYLMHQSITPKLEPEPPEVQEPEPTVEAILEQPDAETPATVSEQFKSGPPEMELLEEAAGFSDYYANKSIDVQNSEQCEQVISIQNNEHFVINQVNVEDPQPQSSSWATNCPKVSKDFKYLHTDKDAIKTTEKFRFMTPKDDAEIDQKLLYAFDGNTPRSDLNLSFLEHETDTDSVTAKTSGKLQDQTFEIANSSKEERPQVRARRGSISEERPRPESDSEHDFSPPTDLNVSKEHAHVKFAIPAITDPAISFNTYIEESDLEFPSDPDYMNSFRYMYPSQNAGFSVSSSSIDPELNYPSLEAIAIDEDVADHVQSSHVVHFAPLSTDPGSGEMSESSSFFTHTLNTAESFIKRLEDTVYSENLTHQGEVGTEVQVAGPSNVTILMQKQFSAGSGQSENTGNQLLTLMALHQDMVSISGSTSVEHEGDKDDVATPQHPGHLQLERKTPEMDLPTVEKDMHHKIEEDLRSFQESINQIVDVNKKTISIINSSEISSPNDSISIVSSGGLIQTSSVEDAAPEKGNCHQTSVNKHDAPLLDSFQPRLNPTNISSSASSRSHLSIAQQDSEVQSSTQDDPLSEQDIDAQELSADDFMVQARQIREQITAKLKKKKLEEDDILQEDTVEEIQNDENHVSTSTTQMAEHPEDATDDFTLDETVFKQLLQNEEMQVNLKKSRARRDLSSCCMLKVQNLDLENGEIQRTSKKTNLIDEMLVHELLMNEQQRPTTVLDAEELSKRLQNDTMASFQEKNSCFYVGTQIDEICNEMGRLCLSADCEKVPVNNFNFGLRKSQIFKGELDKRVKVSFGECGSSSSADNAANASYCSKMCDNDETLARTPIDKSIEE